VTDLMVHDGLWEIFNSYHNGFYGRKYCGKIRASAERNKISWPMKATGGPEQLLPAVRLLMKSFPW